MEATRVMCTLVLFSGRCPLKWQRALLSPLHKKGDTRDTSNYRNLALRDIVAKVYTAALTRRLRGFLEASDRLVEEQGGFRQGRGTLDHLMVLDDITRRRLSQGKTTFACFVDLTKAYDTVFRARLWRKLWDAGVRGAMWSAIKALYADAVAALQVGDTTTDWFRVKVGLQQGDALSPLLFALYINEAARMAKGSNLGVKLDGQDGPRVPILLFADDVVLLGETAEDLQSLMHIVGTELERDHLAVSPSKTEVVVFDPATAGSDTSGLTMQGQPVSRAEDNTYQYLGVRWAGDLTWREQVVRKVNSHVFNHTGALTKAHRLGLYVRGGLPPRLALRIIGSHIRPMTLYGAEIWGVTPETFQDSVQRVLPQSRTSTKKRTVEQIAVTLAAQMLGVPITTSFSKIRGEAGWWSQQAHNDEQTFLLLWRVDKIARDPKQKHRLVGQSYRASLARVKADQQAGRVTEELWLSRVYDRLRQYGLLAEWLQKPWSRRKWKQHIRLVIHQVEEMRWKTHVKSSQQGRQYLRELHPKLRAPIYLSVKGTHESTRVRTALRIRGSVLGDHRRRGGSTGACPLCHSGAVETVQHFLLECPFWATLRKRTLHDRLRADLSRSERRKWEAWSNRQRTWALLGAEGRQWTTRCDEALRRKLLASSSAAMTMMYMARERWQQNTNRKRDTTRG